MRTLRVWKTEEVLTVRGRGKKPWLIASVEMSVVLWQIFPFHCLRLQRKGNMDPFKFFLRVPFQFLQLPSKLK